MAKKEIKEEVMKVINEAIVDEANKTIIRIVKWNNGKPLLEKRGFYLDEEVWKPARAKGFNSEDFEIIKANLDEIEKILSSEVKEEKE